MRRALAILVLCAPRVAAADVFANPTSVTCPPAAVGTTSTPVSVSLTKGSGSASVTITVGNCSGGGGTFNVPSDVSVPTSIDITYTPSALGTRTCTITASNFGGSDATITATGTGYVPPMISVTTPTAFASVRVLDTAVAAHTSTRTVTVSNTGGGSLSITNVTFTGDFSIDPSSPNGTSTTIAGSGAKTWTLRFDPSAVGTRNGSVTFHSDAVNAPTINVPLTGQGTSGLYSISQSASGNFGTVVAGTSAGLDIGVTHNGAAPKGTLTFGTVTVSNATQPWFSISAQPNTVTSSGTISVVCSPPTGATATATATVNIQADADASANQTQNVSCTGGSSVLVLDMSTLDTGTTLLGTTSAVMTINLTNTGTSNATVGFVSGSINAARFSAAGPGGCGVGANNCNVPMGGGSIPITLTFTPTIEATVSASFNVQGAGAAPSFIATGKGIDRHIYLTEAVQFEDTFKNPGSQATVAPVTIQNLGEYPIIVSAVQLGGPGAGAFSVDDSLLPLTVLGLGTADVMVAFAPVVAGKADDGQLLIVNDDTKFMNGMPIVILSGNGKDRNVDVTPGLIDLGDRAVGIPTRLSVARPGQRLIITNNDTADFTIRELAVSDGGQLVVAAELPSGGSAAGQAIAMGQRHEVDLVITPTQAGPLEATLGLYLDEDPVPQTLVVVRLNAVSVDIHGGGGCSTGAGAGPLAMLALLRIVCRRPARRRRP